MRSLAVSSYEVPFRLTPTTFNAFFDRRADESDGALYELLPVENGLFLCEDVGPSSSPVKRLWIIDADDTLWEDNIHYDAIIAELVCYAIENGCPLPASEIRGLVDAAECRTMAEVGVGVYGFERSMRAAWRTIRETYIPHAAEPTALLDKIIPFLSGVPYQIPLSTVSFLKGLKSDRENRLVLFTQGPLKTQLGKIANSGLAPLFDGIAVGNHKHVSAYQELLRRMSFVAHEYIVVGNSLNSEVKPALELGLGAFHLNNPHSWHRMNTDTINRDAYITVTCLTDVLKYVPNSQSDSINPDG